MLADEFITSETDVLDKCITNITSRNIIVCRLILCDIDLDIFQSKLENFKKIEFLKIHRKK